MDKTIVKMKKKIKISVINCVKCKDGWLLRVVECLLLAKRVKL